MIGEPVYAIGNPFGYTGTMTRGIISAVDRTLEVSPTKSYKGLIQTDASINPGNSGGPLLNAYGQVIGMNTAIRADARGIGFAIAVSNMRDLLPAFLNPEALNRAQVGFTLEEKAPEQTAGECDGGNHRQAGTAGLRGGGGGTQGRGRHQDGRRRAPPTVVDGAGGAGDGQAGRQPGHGGAARQG